MCVPCKLSTWKICLMDNGFLALEFVANCLNFWLLHQYISIGIDLEADLGVLQRVVQQHGFDIFSHHNLHQASAGEHASLSLLQSLPLHVDHTVDILFKPLCLELTILIVAQA
eukprot:Gb_25649 [translate_table: standard]